MSERLPKRQGDIRLVPVENRTLQGRRYRIRERGEGLVIAAGEATGHHHRVRDTQARVFDQEGKTFLRVARNGAVLTHEEHAPIELEAGTYEVVRQRELDLPADRVGKPRPLGQERTRQVWD